ncbi:hypothetical protein ACLX1H_001459 [Fusarium chlamydosporum]
MSRDPQNLTGAGPVGINDGRGRVLQVAVMLEKHTHVIQLGQATAFFNLGHSDHPALKIPSIEEHERADRHGGGIPMPTNRRLCAFHGHGRDAVWPPFDPGRPRKEFEYEMIRHCNLVGQRWLKLNELVLGSEDVIQNAILKLSQGDVKDKDGKTLDIEHYLKISWEAARDTYNATHATEPGDMTSGFRLDPNGSITPNRSADLDVFALVYLAGQSGSFHCDNWAQVGEGDRYIPLYRNGANYMDDRQAFEEALLDDEKFQRLRKPGPNASGKIKFNHNVEGFLEKHRASFLVPHINLLDLTNTLNLLLFIHHRARFLPREFAYKDHHSMFLGERAKILSGACDPTAQVYFKSFTDKDEAGFPLKPVFWYSHQEWDKDRFEDYLDLKRRDLVMNSMSAWLTLQSQAITYLFLTNFCKHMLLVARKNPVYDPLSSLTHQQIVDIETAAAKTIDATRGKKQIETLDDIESIRQYEPGHDVINFHRYQNLLANQRNEAEQHIRILFDDPDYFTRKVIEEKEHHWNNLRVGYDEAKSGPYVQKYYDDERMRHALYVDCMRNVLRRAFFDFFIWDAIERTLRNARLTEEENFPEPTHIEYVGGGKEVRAWRDQLCGREAAKKHVQLHIALHLLIRQAAAFYIFEFRKQAIHAASPPMRDTYCIPNADKMPADLVKHGYYDTPDIELNFRHQASPSERLEVPRMVLELIENFVSNKESATFVGMRKTTARILRYFDECEDDKATREKFSDLIRDNVRSLHILSEIVDHMDHQLPHLFRGIVWDGDYETNFRGQFSRVLERFGSYDLMSLDGCSFGESHVPDKRIKRMFGFLDEMQGIGKRNENSYGAARGDIKRFGSSLLKGLIYPLATKDKKLQYEYRAETSFVVSNEALERLTRHMGIKNDQWPFHPDEQPWNTLSEAPETDRKHYQGLWKDLRLSMSELSKQNRKRLKKPWAQGSKASNMYDFVTDEVKLAQAMIDASKRQMNSCVKKRKAKKKTLDARRKEQEEARQRASEIQDAEMQDVPDQEIVSDTSLPSVNEDNVEAADGLVQDMDIDPEAELDLRPEPEAEAEQPQALVPPPAAELDDDDEDDYDGPKIPLNKNHWHLWDAIFPVDYTYKPKVSYNDLVSAVEKIGFKWKSSSGGSHNKYVYKEGAEHIPNVTSLTLVRPHSGIGDRADVPKFLLQNWRYFMRSHGLTLKKLEKRYSRV